MDTPTLLKTLRDPMGDPFYPIVFQALMVLTFSLHILLVNTTVGAAALAVYGRLRSEAPWRRLAASMAKAVTMSVSALIVLGVAPLLFVQVVYDPLWYASSNLSAAWSVGFIFVMMAAFGVSYAAYLRGDKPGALPLGALALALFVTAGVLMHVFGYQALQPDRWLAWYAKAGGVDSSGTTLHSFSLPRFLHFMVPAFAVGGVFLMLQSWYLGDRADADAAYLDWTARLGASLAFWATAAQCVGGVWWLMVLPPELHFARNPVFLAGGALGLALLGFFGWVNFSKRPPQESALVGASLMVVVTLVMSTSRELMRMGYVGRFGYSIFDRKMSVDWGSTALFLGTFVMGLSILGYVLSTAFQSGRVAGRYEASSRMQAWGRVSIGLLLAWIAVVAGLGVVITVRNL